MRKHHHIHTRHVCHVTLPLKSLSHKLHSMAASAPVVDLAPPKRFVCPITMEIMQEPHICKQCGNNFEYAAIMQAVTQDGKCSLCRRDLRPEDLVPNRALKEEIGEWLKTATTADPIEPLCAVFVGKFGVGKSSAINTLAGLRVALARQAATGVTLVPSVAFEGPMSDGVSAGKAVRLIDAPGLFDPDRSNEVPSCFIFHGMNALSILCCWDVSQKVNRCRNS